MLPRCLRFNQCIGVDLVDLEVRDGTSAKALNRGLLGHRAPNCSALVDKLHREDRDERVQNCLGGNILAGRRSLYMIRVQNSWEVSSRTRQELQAS